MPPGDYASNWKRKAGYAPSDVKAIRDFFIRSALFKKSNPRETNLFSPLSDTLLASWVNQSKGVIRSVLQNVGKNEGTNRSIPPTTQAAYGKLLWIKTSVQAFMDPSPTKSSEDDASVGGSRPDPIKECAAFAYVTRLLLPVIAHVVGGYEIDSFEQFVVYCDPSFAPCGGGGRQEVSDVASLAAALRKHLASLREQRVVDPIAGNRGNDFEAGLNIVMDAMKYVEFEYDIEFDDDTTFEWVKVPLLADQAEVLKRWKRWRTWQWQVIPNRSPGSEDPCARICGTSS